MTKPGEKPRPLAARTRWLPCATLLVLLSACVDGAEQARQRDEGSHESDGTRGASGLCTEPSTGCACTGNQPPIACRPEAPPASEEGEAELCYEGTRYCRAGVWSSCENVHGFAKSALAETQAIVDQDASHPPCSECEPECFRVIDTLDPADGTLDPSFATGVRYHRSGAGIALEPLDGGVSDGGLPSVGVTVTAVEGVPAIVQYSGQYRPGPADVYLLVDQSTSLAEETLWLYDTWDANGAYLNAALPCASGNQTLVSQGISGAFACMFGDVEMGAGMFRDIPFEPYATDSTLPATEQSANAKQEIAFRNQQTQSADAALTKNAIASFGGVQSSGNPDFAASQVPALHAVASGQGMSMGLSRVSVPDAAACPAGRYGYPCFRSTSDAMVVLVTDAPMHNGPAPATYPYDYDPSYLTTSSGTAPFEIAVPATNDTVGNAYLLSANTESILATFVGSTAGFAPDVPASIASCSADDAAPDAVFRFDVSAPSGAVPITFSTEGSSFATTLSVHDGPPPVDQLLPGTGDTNERFDAAASVGDVAGRSVVISGDTTKPSDPTADMLADYQGSLFGNACGANTLAPDAAFAFDVSSASGPIDLALSLDMGANHSIVSVYQAGVGALPRWPVHTTTLVASGNDSAHASPYDLPSGAGNEYITVTGDTSTLTADYDPSVLGSCNPNAAAPDAAFHLQVSGTRTLRFDTEGSAFDTVLSLHSRPPLGSNGNWVTYPASATHDNGNETASSAYAIGNVVGRQVIYQGDTTGMSADIDDRGACGLDGGCGDAVYSLTVSQRTTLRLSVTGTGYQPGLQITRADPSAFVPKVHTVATGDAHTCALSGGQAYCWGSDANGELGDGSASGGDTANEVTVSGLSGAVDIAAGLRHTCAALADGRVMCWGQGTGGRLGNGSQTSALAPVQVQSLGSGASDLGRAIQLAAGDSHSCALLHDGRIACWGTNSSGQLGDTTLTMRTAPVLVDGTDRFVFVAASGAHTCAIRNGDRAVRCWGDGRYGQVGDGNTNAHSVSSPYLISGLTNATSLGLGASHSCATRSSGRVMCWGRNNAGQLGQGNTTDRATPAAVQTYDGAALLDNATDDLTAGASHTCARMLEGYVFCWGSNGLRQLGDGTTSSTALRPTGVAGVIDAGQVVSYANHTCTLRRSGDLACWGAGARYQLGNGSTVNQNKPVIAQPGQSGAKVSFGTGNVDMPFALACQSRGQAPEAGCSYAQNGAQAYQICATQSRTWHSAALACSGTGMELLDVDASGENAFVASRLSGPAWIGAKRASSSDWLSLEDNTDFQNLAGERIWHTTRPYKQTCLFGFCSTTTTLGYFVNDTATDPAAPDLIDSNPWGSTSTWASNAEPKPTDSSWGYNCATLNAQGKWATDACSAVPDPGCGFNILCILGALLGGLLSLVGGVLSWLTLGFIDLGNLVNYGNGGVYSSPHFAGGVERPYVCEAKNDFRDVTLDPGAYYVTVKGIADGQTGNACTGPYDLRIADVGTPSGGLIACDDNGVADTQSSVIEATLSSGDYYLVLKGKSAGDAGSYNLTVRDVSAVQASELACDASSGTSDPAQLVFTAQPGNTYYALVKGDTPNDKGPYSLAIRDVSRITGQLLSCDATSGPGGSSALSVPLGTGTYYAVLKGTAPGASGDYRLTVGGATATTTTFTPPTYDDALQALTAGNLRVATVLSCDGNACADATGQAAELAQDTQGVVRTAASAADVPQQVVSAVYDLASLDSVKGQLVFTPDPNPGFVNVGTFSVPGSLACIDSGDGNTLVQCGPGSSPTYRVLLENPLLTPVPPGPGPMGSYEFTLHLEGQRDGVVRYSEDVPFYVVPVGGATAGSYSAGSYTQDMDGRGCVNRGNLAPSWSELVFDADVRPDTQLAFHACTANRASDLAQCASAGASASGFARVVTVTAGSGLGVPCSVVTQAIDCPSGYCSPYTNVCQFLEGASCTSDADCPGTTAGRCHDGPSVATLGKTCMLNAPVASPANALDTGDLQPHLRMRVDLGSGGNGSRTPSLFFWETRYRCKSVL